MENNNLIDAFTFIPSNNCGLCGGIGSIDIYNNYNSPCNYMSKIANGEITNVKAYGSYMKCRKCGQTFLIDWSRGDIPYPLYSKDFYNIFINEFLKEE